MRTSPFTEVNIETTKRIQAWLDKNCQSETLSDADYLQETMRRTFQNAKTQHRRKLAGEAEEKDCRTEEGKLEKEEN